ncbi:MAG: hypothetical protein GX945_09430 [Lentisphaerae bacterium]|jgi:cell division protein FtsI/penicillin-binding protein 2|nr:hypothetical protein [Lentisphaerota bacterium]
MMSTAPANALTPAELRWKRAQRLTLVFMLCAAVITARIIWLAMQSKAARELIRNQARTTQSVTIPGMRGRIISRDGIALAYSERRLRLLWQVPADLCMAEAILARWEAMDGRPFPLPPRQDLPAHLGHQWQIADDLDMRLPALWQMTQVPENGLSLRAYFVRNYSPNQALRDILGTVHIDPGTGLECGLTGMEKEYDKELRGHVVTFSLLATSRRAFIKENKLWQENQGNGRDIRLDIHACAKR